MGAVNTLVSPVPRWSADFCACLLGIYDRREGTDFFRRYADAFTPPVDPMKERVRALGAELQKKEQVFGNWIERLGSV
jgi:hypothetical protein